MINVINMHPFIEKVKNLLVVDLNVLEIDGELSVILVEDESEDRFHAKPYHARVSVETVKGL